MQQLPDGVGSKGGDGHGNDSSFMKSKDCTTSKNTREPIKDIVAESLKIKLERDNRERLRRVSPRR